MSATPQETFYVDLPLPVADLNKRSFWQYEKTSTGHQYTHISSGDVPATILKHIEFNTAASGDISFAITLDSQHLEKLKAQLKVHLPILQGVTYQNVTGKGQTKVSLTIPVAKRFTDIPKLLIVLQQLETLPFTLREHIYLHSGIPHDQDSLDNDKLISAMSRGRDKVALIDLAITHATLSRSPENYLSIAKACEGIPALSPKIPEVLKLGIALIDSDAAIKMNTDPQVIGELCELFAQLEFENCSAFLSKKTEKPKPQNDKNSSATSEKFVAITTAAQSHERTLYSAYKHALKSAATGWLPGKALLKKIVMAGSKGLSNMGNPAENALSDQDYEALNFNAENIEDMAKDLWQHIARADTDPQKHHSEAETIARSEEIKREAEMVTADSQLKAVQARTQFYSYLPLSDTSLPKKPLSYWKTEEAPLEPLVAKDKAAVLFNFKFTSLSKSADNLLQINYLGVQNIISGDRTPSFRLFIGVASNQNGLKFFADLMKGAPEIFKWQDLKEVVNNIKFVAADFPKTTSPDKFLELFKFIEQHTVLPINLKRSIAKSLGFDYSQTLTTQLGIPLASMIRKHEPDAKSLNEGMALAEQHKSSQSYWELANACRHITQLQEQELPALLACIKLVETHSAIRSGLTSESIGDLYADAADFQLRAAVQNHDKVNKTQNLPERDRRLFSAFTYALKGAQYQYPRAASLVKTIIRKKYEWADPHYPLPDVERINAEFVAKWNFSFPQWNAVESFGATMWFVLRPYATTAVLAPQSPVDSSLAPNAAVPSQAVATLALSGPKVSTSASGEHTSITIATSASTSASNASASESSASSSASNTVPSSSSSIAPSISSDDAETDIDADDTGSNPPDSSSPPPMMLSGAGAAAASAANAASMDTNATASPGKAANSETQRKKTKAAKKK